MKMDNAAFERDASGGEVPRRHGVVTTTVELGEFAASRTGQPLAPLCKPDLCRAMMPLHAAVKTPAMRPNPWHRYKTVFLVVTVVGLVIWALAYVGLVYAKVL